MQEVKQIIQDLEADPYEILCTEPGSEPSVLRKNYRNLAIKYHPDKNDSMEAKIMFLKVNQAYEFLEIEANREKYNMYIKTIEEQKKRVSAMDDKRKQLIEDLKRREEEHTRTLTQIQKQLKKRKQFFKRKMEEEQQRQAVKNQVFEELGTQKYYQLISSFDVSWPEGFSFTENMLRMAFKPYGVVTNIKIQNKRNRAVITFNSIEDCTSIVQKFRNPQISIKFHLDSVKRNHLLKALNKQKVDKIDLTLNSDNIERFKQIINRGSGMYRQNYRQDF